MSLAKSDLFVRLNETKFGKIAYLYLPRLVDNDFSDSIISSLTKMGHCMELQNKKFVWFNFRVNGDNLIFRVFSFFGIEILCCFTLHILQDLPLPLKKLQGRAD